MPQYGMNLDPNNPSGGPNPDKLKDIKWVRMVFNAEPGNLQPLNVDQLCAHYGGIVDNYRNAGINTLFVLNHQIAVDFRPPAGNIIDQNYIDKFSTKCGQIAARLKGKGVAYEIWNEQDQASDSAKGIAKESFKPLLFATSAQIKAADPSATRVLGGLVSGDPVGYLRGCVDAQGRLPVHAIGIHPYTKFRDTSGLTSALKNISSKFSGLHLWLTEFNDGGIVNDEQDQLATVNLGKFAGALPSVVDVAIWYCWSDGINPGFGVVRDDGSEKKISPTFFNVAKGGSGTIVMHEDGVSGGGTPIVHPAASFTNQDVINAFFAAAAATGADPFKLMADAGLGFLLSIKKSERPNAYTGTPIADLPNLTPQQHAILMQDLSPTAPGLGLAAAAPLQPLTPSAVAELKLNILWVSQMDKKGKGNNDCGDASVLTLLHYYDFATPSREEVFNVLQGRTTAKQLIGLAANFGLTLTSELGSVDPLVDLLSNDKPIILPVEYKRLKFPIHLAAPAPDKKGDDQGAHWVVAVGYDATGFFVHDPLWMPNQNNGQGGLGGAFLHINTDTLTNALIPTNNMLYQA